MVHCDPAPPHPPAGEIYNVICPPPGGWLVAIGLLVAITLAMGLLIWHFTEDAEGRTAGGGR